MLTMEMIDLITTYTIGCVATVRSDGLPAVSPKATFLVLDDQTIAFANIRSEGTVENLLRCPDVEINFIDVFARKGCRVHGRAHYLLRDEVESGLLMKFKDPWPDLYDFVQGIVTIDVTEAEILTSPSYDVGAVADQLTEQWLRRYGTSLGFAVTKQPEVNVFDALSTLGEVKAKPAAKRA